MNVFKNVAVVLLAGALGGLANSIAVWALGAAGVSAALGFQMTPALTPTWLMPRLVMSALWGLLFLLPFWKDAIYRKAVILSFVPAVFMLLVFFPKMKLGLFGLKAGSTAPVFVFVLTQLWGAVAASVISRFATTADH